MDMNVNSGETCNYDAVAAVRKMEVSRTKRPHKYGSCHICGRAVPPENVNRWIGVVTRPSQALIKKYRMYWDLTLRMWLLPDSSLVATDDGLRLPSDVEVQRVSYCRRCAPPK